MVAAPPRPEAADPSLLEIVRSHRAVGLLATGAGLLAVGSLLAGIGFVVASNNSLRTTHDLLSAAGWLSFAAVAAGLAAVGEAGWARLIRGGWLSGVELGGVTLASLLVAIGFLMEAASPNNDSDTGSVLAAIGLGGWLLVLLYHAAHRAIAEQAGGPGHQVDLWLIAAAAVGFLAVATGLPGPVGNEASLAISTEVLFVIGFAGLAVALELALRRWQVSDHRIGVVVVGLVVLALGHLAAAISAGYVFSRSADVNTVRVGLSIPAFLETIGWAVLAWAACGRRIDLAGPRTGIARPTRGWHLFGPRAAGETEEAAGGPAPFTGPVATAPPPPPPAPVPGGAQESGAPEGAGGPAPEPTEVLAGPDPTRPLEPPMGEGPPPQRYHCDQPLPAGYQFCPYCGQAVGADS